MLLFLLACSDYALNQKAPTDGALGPDIEVNPLDIQLDAVCGTENTSVTLSNVGDSILNVTGLDVDGDGWSREALQLPLSLDPGASQEVRLNTTGGSGILRVSSDDVEEPVVEVALMASPDLPPTVSIDRPAEGVIVSEGATVQVSGTVSDDVDAPEALSLVWSNNAGVLDSSPAEADGGAGFSWDAASRSAGDQSLNFTATDSCGQSTSATVNFCQDASYTYDALSLASWHYEGVAQWDSTNGYLQLTSADPNLVGTAFETSTTVSGDNVNIDFTFYIGGGTGADGISLTALDTSRMTTFLGGNGCGIGYGGDASCTAGPALPGWSLEVDTYYNEGQDPTAEDHIAFTFDGDVDNVAAWAALPEMEDNGWHHMEVNVQAPHLRVIIDNVTYLDQDLSGNFSFPAYVGFTAGTGGLTNYHLIDELTVTDHLCGD